MNREPNAGRTMFTTLDEYWTVSDTRRTSTDGSVDGAIRRLMTVASPSPSGGSTSPQLSPGESHPHGLPRRTDDTTSDGHEGSNRLTVCPASWSTPTLVHVEMSRASLRRRMRIVSTSPATA